MGSDESDSTADESEYGEALPVSTTTLDKEDVAALKDALARATETKSMDWNQVFQHPDVNTIQPVHTLKVANRSALPGKSLFVVKKGAFYATDIQVSSTVPVAPDTLPFDRLLVPTKYLRVVNVFRHNTQEDNENVSRAWVQVQWLDRLADGSNTYKFQPPSTPELKSSKFFPVAQLLFDAHFRHKCVVSSWGRQSGCKKCQGLRSQVDENVDASLQLERNCSYVPMTYNSDRLRSTDFETWFKNNEMLALR